MSSKDYKEDNGTHFRNLRVKVTYLKSIIMADRVVYGIKSLKFMPAVTTGENAGSFPNFSEASASLYDMKMIVPDSFNMNQEDPEKIGC